MAHGSWTGPPLKALAGIKPVAGKKGLPFAFALSEDATVRFEIRRDGSPARRLCPVRGGKRAGTYTRLSKTTSKQTAGRHDVSLATTASRRTTGPVRLRAGRRSVAAGRRLRPGTYVLRMTAATATGRSDVVSVKFWVSSRRSTRG